MSDSNDPNILVKYVSNADASNATGGLTFDGRETLELGGVGYVTETELHQAVSHGIVLETIEEDEAREQGLLVDPDPADRPLDDLSNQELRDLAKDEGTDVKGLTKNEEIAAAIEKGRADKAAGAASQPATAPSSTPTPIVAQGTSTSGGGSAS